MSRSRNLEAICQTDVINCDTYAPSTNSSSEEKDGLEQERVSQEIIVWYCVTTVYATETAGFCLVSFVCFEAGSYYSTR